MPDTQSTTKFRADISSLRAEMQAAARLVRVANSEFKAATSGMDSWSSSADGLEKKIKQLNTVLTAQRRQAALAKQEWEKTKQVYGENSAEADRAKIRMNQYDAAVGRTERELRKYENELENVDKETAQTTKETAKASEGFTVMKGVLADLVASGIRKAISGLKDLGNYAREAYREFDEGQDNVIKKTGATGQSADQLRDVYKKVIKEVGGDFGDLGNVIGELNTRFGFEGGELEKSAISFQKFAKVTGTDATEAVRLVSRAMGDAGIDAKDYGDVLDMLTTASQQSGISVDNLAESLTKYGAPMRNLGFDTKESIAIFSQWEKAGVNTQIAFSGMRKAISNWSKDGKDAKEEFKKTLKEIEKTPSRAKATQKAIEVFGAKAGPDLADAILEGRFAYEDFLSLIESSSGSLDGTFDETLDGADKVRLALQGAKADIGSFVSDLMSKYQPEIETFIQNATEKAKELITYVVTNREKIVGTITAISTVLGTLFVADKVSKFINTMKTFSPVITTLATKIGLVTVAEETATGATLAFNTALLANPATWVVIGLGAMAAALVKLRAEQEKAIEEEYGLSDAQKKSIEATKQAADQYKQTSDARSESIQSTESEFAYIEHLKDEYNSLIDSNGKVKKGYKDRADFIINQLAEALGVERSEIEKNIGKNGELGSSIDKLIEKKKAEAILSAGEGAYKEAIQKQQESYTNLINAQNAATEAQNAYDKSIEESGNVLDQYNEKLKTSPSTADDFYWANQTVIEGQKQLKENVETTNKSLQTAENTYVGYNTTIKNYEGLSAAIISGDSKKIGDAISKMKNNFITAETGTQSSLQRQTSNLKTNLDQMKQAVADGSPYVTQAMVTEMEKLVKQSEKELKKLEPMTREEEKKASESGAKAYSSAKGKHKKAAADVRKAVSSEEKKGKSESQKNAKARVEAGAKAYSSGKGKQKKAVTDVNKEINKVQKSTKKDFEKSGKEQMDSHAKGIKSKKGSVVSAVNDVSNQAKSTLKSGQQSAGYQAGSDLGQGYVNGIRSKIPAARKAAADLARAGTKTIPKTQKSGSPSKLTFKSGVEFTQGYINGITSLQGKVVDTVKGMVTGATNELLKLSGWNFSEVGQMASSVFGDAVSKKMNYTIDRITYKNEAKLSEFDSTISELEKKKKAESDKLTKASEKKQKALEAKIDKASKTKQKNKLKKQLQAEKDNLKKLIKASDEKYSELISTQNKYKNAYQEASSKFISEFQNALTDYQNKAQQLIDDTINGITNRYQTDYDALISKQESLIEKLKTAGDLFEVSGAGVMTVNDLKAQTKAITDYTEKLTRIKAKVSKELFDQITTYDMDQGSAFMDRLLAMSTSDLEAYNQAYTEKMEAAQKAGDTIYKTDFETLKKNYESEVNKAFKNIPKQLEDLGKEAMKGFVSGLTTNTDYMNKNIRTWVSSMLDTFKKELKISSPSKVMYEIGDFTVMGFTDALKDGILSVRDVVGSIASEVSTPLSGLDINAGLVRSTANQGLYGSSSVSNVTNNYNLVQNNTSPKPLSALETYQARRRQISMVKAMTQAV